jgi:hypothetical protein
MNTNDGDVCPIWCVADHPAEDEQGNSRHRAEVISVPVIQADGAHAELFLEKYQFVSDPTVWVYLGDGTRQYLDLSAESAHRVAVALKNYLVGLG